MFLEFQANQNGYGDIIDLGMGDSTQTQLSQVPYALVLDRVYVHGDPVMGQKRGVALNSSDTQVLNSWISDCKAVGQDTQALGGYNGPGNYLIENNYLEAATENVLFGGADPPIPNLVTTNITFRRNYLSKPIAWRDPIVATPAAVAAIATPGDGTLAAGTYLLQGRRARHRQGRPTTPPLRPRPKSRRRLPPARPAASRSRGHRSSARPITSCYGRTAGARERLLEDHEPVLHRHRRGRHERHAGDRRRSGRSRTSSS